MKNNKKLNNKGFSLVELIIVVAIMAVLVGVLAPQYMRYVDRSRAGVDEQYADNIRSAMQTCLLDPNITGAPASTTWPLTDVAVPTPGASALATDFWVNVYDILGLAHTADVRSALSLDTDTTQVSLTYSIDAQGNVSIEISGGDYDDFPVAVG